MDIVDLSREAEELRDRFLQTQEVTDGLYHGLSPEDCLLSVTEDTSPPKWHLGHTSWFFARFFLTKFSGFEITPEFDYLFNSYYKGVGQHIPKSERGMISRPGFQEIFEWRQMIRELVVSCLEELSIDEIPEVRQIMEMGINHEQQHQELLLMDVKRNFFSHTQRPRFKGPSLSSAHESKAAIWINVPSGLTKIGMPLGHDSFHYDNESDSHLRWIDSFMLMSHPVTNGEYLTFIQNGGYQNPRYWLSDGWDLVNKESWRHPLYWEERDGDWWIFTLWGMVPLDLAAPVCHVSYYEADAFARFQGARLPTEFEWETAAAKVPLSGNFLESGIYEAILPEEGKEFTAIHGTAWEWTQSAYLPYPRYENYPGILSEYNGKFMVNQMVLRGGSCVTPESHYRVSYRNFYYPHMRWQFGGIRLAKDLA